MCAVLPMILVWLSWRIYLTMVNSEILLGVHIHHFLGLSCATDTYHIVLLHITKNLVAEIFETCKCQPVCPSNDGM